MLEVEDVFVFIGELLCVDGEGLLIGLLVGEGVLFEEMEEVGFGVFDDVADG